MSSNSKFLAGADDLKPIIIIDTVVSLFCIIANILLLVAAIKNNYQKLLLFWLVASILTFITTVVLHTVGTIQSKAYVIIISQDGKDILLFLLNGIIYFGAYNIPP